MRPTDKGELFSAKLRELERRQEETVLRLHLFQRADHAQVRQGLKQLRQEEREDERLLQQSIDAGRSPAVAALSQAQLEHLRRVRSILCRDLPGYVHSDGASLLEDRAEAACLYGEYAMDAAALAMRHALLATLQAMDLRMSCEEQSAQTTKHHIQEDQK